MKKILYKKEILIIIFGIILNFLASHYNLNKFDKIYKNYDGQSYNQITGSDLLDTWEFAETFRKKISETGDFFDSLPHYERFYLPSIIVGYYYYIIDKEIYETIETGEKVVKVDNYKFGLLLIQILSYYFVIYLFVNTLKEKYKIKYSLILLIFLSFEPTIIQWHHSFWSESLFITMMIFLFYLVLKKSNNFFIDVLLGFLVALMFAQRAVSFLYILPVVSYYILVKSKNLKNLILLISSFIIFMSFIVFNNHNKTGTYYLIPAKHQYGSYYHSFATRIFADKHDISREKAQIILNDKEKKWRQDNDISVNIYEEYSNNLSKNDIKINNDFLKAIDYRNKMFVELVVTNPLYFSKLFIKRVLLMSQFSPTWVKQSYENDKTSPEAKYNAAEYYNRNLIRNVFYSLIFYIFILIGFSYFLKDIFYNKNFSSFNRFLIFQIISISYFVLISGLWGNPKYFVPCIISLSIFFAQGLNLSIIFFKNKLFN